MKVASPLIPNLITAPILTDVVIVTVRREVADWMLAGPGVKDYEIVSILLQATDRIELLGSCGPQSSGPSPRGTLP